MPMTKTDPLLISCLLLAGCARHGPAPVPSPDGSMTLHTRVEQSRSDPRTYLCVIFEVRDKSGRRPALGEHEGVGSMRCEMSWVTNERVRLRVRTPARTTGEGKRTGSG